MADQAFIGEIRMFGGNFAPQGWALCQGQTMQISQNQALFTLIGTTYGGDGTQTFALPNLQGRVPVHFGQGQGLSPYVQGETVGVETVTLIANQIPAHTHVPQGDGTNGGSNAPGGNFWGTSTGVKQYLAASTTQMNPAAIALAGGNQPHDNMLPFLAVNFIIALFGVFPSRN